MLKSLGTMLSKRRPQGRRTAAAIPEGQRIYAIGDIHGQNDLLRDLLRQIKADSATYKGRVTLVGIGDYIDRGPDSRGVVETLVRDVPKTWECVFLRGNHEQAMIDFMETASLSERDGGRYEWLAWGGLQALESYGVPTFGAMGLRNGDVIAAEFFDALEENGHKGFFEKTQLSFICGDYLFVHAGVRRGLTAEQQMPEDLLFIREDFIGQPHDLPYRVVFGHTILEKPLIEDDRIGLDTGAFQSGILTAVRLEGDTVRIMQALDTRPTKA